MDATVVIADLKPAEETRPTIDFSELQAALNAEVQEAEKSIGNRTAGRAGNCGSRTC